MKKRFIKLIGLILALSMSMSCLAGCGGNSNSTTEQNISVADTEATEQSVASAENEEIVTTEENDASQAPEESEKNEASTDSISTDTTQEIESEIPSDTTSESMGEDSETETSENTTPLDTEQDATESVGESGNPLEDELAEIEDMDTDELTPTQRNAINMLNYMTVLTQEINDSKQSRIFLDTAYNSLINNTYPNAVDSKTQTQITSMLDTLHQYQMINVKRARLEYIYEQNKAQAMRQAIPNPVGLLSAVQSGSLLKAAASVLYMAVDSVSSYQAASNQADLQYLKDGWALDDAEAEEVHKSRTGAFNYLLRMVNDNGFDGDYSLNEDMVSDFVTWKNKTNLVSKISWFESHEDTYKMFGPYWLELAKDYYDSGEYESCLSAFEKYEEVTTRIFRQDLDYAKALPMAIIAAKETMPKAKYIDYADKYTQVILKNTDDWSIRYFVAQIYMDLYANTNEKDYLDKAYKIAYDNVNVLVEEQKNLNAVYLADVEEIKAEDGATKQQKKDVKQYNKMLKETRKTALPPVSEALYLNCDLLFALIEKRGISTKEQSQIEAILHENGDSIFLTSALDERFRFDGRNTAFDASAVNVEFTGEEIRIPASCVTDRSEISVTVSGENGITTITDWIVKKVERPKNADCSGFIVTYTSETAKKLKYADGDSISIKVTPVAETPNEVIHFEYEAVQGKKLLVLSDIKFERK